MPLSLQAKLLRFLEERTFRRVGGTQEISVDVRIIGATNRDVDKALAEGRFREDLLYRLNVVPIYLPPLRERGDDIKLLAAYYVNEFAREFKKNVSRLDDAAMDKLMAYSWPGNVRELRNVCERAVLLCKSEIIGGDDIVAGRGPSAESSAGTGHFRLPPGGIDLPELEQELIRQALERTEHNQRQAAKLLHISRDTLRYRIRKLEN